MATTLEAIRRMANKYQPFLSRALYSLTPVASNMVPESITCDANWNVYYNPMHLEDYDSRQTQEAAFRMCREVARLLQRHPKRISRLIPKTGTSRSHYAQIASMASTALANQLVCNVPRPPESELLLTVDGLPGCEKLPPSEHVLENVYRKLCEVFPPPREQESRGDRNGNQSSDNGNQSSDQQGRSGGQDQADQADGDEGQCEPSNTSDQGEPSGHQAGQCDNRPFKEAISYYTELPAPDRQGSSVDGMPRDWELPPNEQSSINDREVRQVVAQTVQSNPGIGQGATGAMKRWSKEELINGRLQPPRDLMSLLKEFSESQAGYEMKRYDGRNRRQGPISEYNRQEIYLPHYYAPKFDMLIVLDTSGSMDVHNTTLGMMYIASVLESLGLHQGAHFYTGDTTPTYKGVLTARLARETELHGNGGTHMPDVIRRAMKIHTHHGRPCNLVVCVTDGYSPWNMEPLGVPLLIAITPATNETVEERQEEVMSGEYRHQPPEFAEVTVIENHDFAGADS